MMIIAVLISGMLMPAQIFAKNDRREVKKENRVSVDYNRAKKDNKVVRHSAPAPKNIYSAFSIMCPRASNASYENSLASFVSTTAETISPFSSKIAR